jgi:hypothetical protein
VRHRHERHVQLHNAQIKSCNFCVNKKKCNEKCMVHHERHARAILRASSDDGQKHTTSYTTSYAAFSIRCRRCIRHSIRYATESALALAPAGAGGPARPDPGPRGGVRVGTGTGTALGHRGTARQSLTHSRYGPSGRRAGHRTRDKRSLAKNLEPSLASASPVSQPDSDISHHVTEELVPSPTPVENAPR